MRTLSLLSLSLLSLSLLSLALVGCLERSSRAPTEPLPPSPAAPPPAEPPPIEVAPPESPTRARVFVSASRATQVLVDDKNVYPIHTVFELTPGRHTFVLLGENGARSEPYEREVLMPKNKPMFTVVLPDLGPGSP